MSTPVHSRRSPSSRLGRPVLLRSALMMVVSISAVVVLGAPHAAAAPPNDPGSIGDLVWSDDDGDGVQDPGEPGLPGIAVELRDTAGTVLDTQVSGADGSYVFADLEPASYRVEVTVPVDKAATTRTLLKVKVKSGQVVEDADFGIGPAPGVITGMVFADRGVDGLFDPSFGDTGIDRVRVELSGTDLAGNNVFERTRTSATGEFEFADVAAGSYTLTEIQPDGYDEGEITPGSNAILGANPNELVVELPAGASSEGNTFAEVATGALSGSVYLDDNGNGIYDIDLDEVGLPAVRLTLTGVDEDGNAVNLTTDTEFAGDYIFPRLRPGTYTLTETQPANYVDGEETVGTAGGYNRVNDEIRRIRLRSATAGVGYNFGELAPVPLAKPEGVAAQSADAGRQLVRTFGTWTRLVLRQLN